MNEQVSQAQGVKRKLRVLLFASLALNLLIVGMVLGAVFSHQSEDRHRSPRMSQPGGALTAALSREDRRDVGRELRKAIRAERAIQDDRQIVFDRIIAALNSEPYDPNELRQAVEAHFKWAEHRVELGVDILVKQFDNMSEESRLTYAERLKEVLASGPGRKTEKPRGKKSSWFEPRD